MSKESFDRKLAEIEAIRGAPEDAAIPLLSKALAERSNYASAKAAAIAGERQLRELEPDLLIAFDRFMRDPVKSDPQCWAKNAIVKALKNLGHSDSAIYLRGTEHFQMEPVWGRREDTAATLRGACAHALVGCNLETFSVLTRLTDLLTDPAAPVRIDAARALGQLSAPEGSLPLRLKASVGDEEPEVVGHCLISLLNLDTNGHLPFVARFLDKDDPEIRIEAAAALAESPDPRALEILIQFWERQMDAQVKRALLTLFSGSPVPASADLLRSIAECATEPVATYAKEALNQSRHVRVRSKSEEK